MKHLLNGLVSAAFLGVWLPLLVSGCGARLTPHEMWDRLLSEKGVTTIASLEVEYYSSRDYDLTVYVPDSSGVMSGYVIDSDGQFSESHDRNANEWQGRVNLSPAEIDIDALIARVPAKDAPYQGCDFFQKAVLEVTPTGKVASWTGCFNSEYNEGSLVVDGKPVLDQVDPRDPAQVAALMDSYDDVFGAGTSVKWQAGLREGESTYVEAIPFAENSDCALGLISSGNFSYSPLGSMNCSRPTTDGPAIPFDFGRFSPTLVADIVSRLEAGGVKVSAVAAIIFTGTPEGNLKWQVSTDNISDALEHRELMQGELVPIS